VAAPDFFCVFVQDEIRQCLSVFFPTFAKIDEQGKQNSHVLVSGFAKALLMVKHALRNTVASQVEFSRETVSYSR